jgi:hypothetical protein
MLASDGEGDCLRRALIAVRKRTSERGCVHVLALASEVQVPEEKLQSLTRLLDATGQIQWLDDAREWLCFSETPRNRLYNLCSKVLGASARLHLSELRRALSKSRRLSMCPPQRILGRFIQHHGLGQLQDGVIVANPSVALPPPADSAEGMMLRILEKYGPVLEGEDFAEKCVAEGMNATTHYIYRLISPLFARSAEASSAKLVLRFHLGLWRTLSRADALCHLLQITDGHLAEGYGAGRSLH